MRARQWVSRPTGSIGPAPAGDHEGDRDLQAGGVAAPDHGRFEHVLVLEQHRLDLGRRHPDPARLDHVAVAADEAVVAVGRALIDVAGAQPPVDEGAGR